jgi:hypothetical protein
MTYSGQNYGGRRFPVWATLFVRRLSMGRPSQKKLPELRYCDKFLKAIPADFAWREPRGVASYFVFGLGGDRVSSLTTDVRHEVAPPKAQEAAP